MPPPIDVELLPHSSNWARVANAESLRLLGALENHALVVHHIGSTAIPGIHAKPIIDLMPLVRSVNDLDEMESVFLQLGYRYWGEYGVPGRRYCTLDETSTGKRKFQLHCFESASEEVERHLAFRDYLRANRKKAQEYEEQKHRCQAIHPNDSHAYSITKAAWITAQLPTALTYFRTAAQCD